MIKEGKMDRLSLDRANKESNTEFESSSWAKQEFFDWLQKVATKTNQEADKIPKNERNLVPFLGLGYIKNIRPSAEKKLKTDNLFICDFDDTVFDTTGYHEVIANNCEQIGIARQEFMEIYEQCKIKGESDPAPLYKRGEHIKRLQQLHPNLAEQISQCFEVNDLERFVDQQVMMSLNLAAARSDVKVIILTRGDLSTQQFKVENIKELSDCASQIIYTQVSKKQFLESYLNNSEFAPIREKPISLVAGSYESVSGSAKNPQVFLLDDSPDEIQDFTNLGKDIYFQAMRLRLPRAKRFGKEQKGVKVLESTEVSGDNYGQAIYSAFAGFIATAKYFRPGQNFSATTLFSTQNTLGGYANREKMFAKLSNGEINNWPDGYKDKSQKLRFNIKKEIIERYGSNDWQEYPIGEILQDREMII